MKILAISPYLDISSSALIINGTVKAASTEERFNREKNSSKFPSLSMDWCLKKYNLQIEDLDLIAIPWNPIHHLQNASNRWTNDLRWRGEMLSSIVSKISTFSGKPPSDEMFLTWNGIKIYFYDHHLCHSAFSFFQSNFKQADILSVDGRGEQETCIFARGKDKEIKKLSSITFPHSLGLFYSTFTDYLGFKPNSDEWKVMSLASYSKNNLYYKRIKKLINFTKNGFELDLKYFDYYLFDKRKNLFSEKLINLFSKPNRLKNSKIENFHSNVAFAMQNVFIDAVFHLLKVLKSKSNNSRTSNLIFTGGCALNGVFNGMLDFKKSSYKNSYVSFAPDDSGVAIGAGMLAHHKLSKKKRIISEVKTNYLGPEFSDNQILSVLKNNKIKYQKYKNIEIKIAELLNENRLVGVFNKRMEFGPRALGNRSILANPKIKENVNLINKAIKFRESFRPFAPAVLDKYKDKIFQIPQKREVNFMERVYKIKKEWRKKIPAVTHVDGTGRLQTVSKLNNTRFFNIISEFQKISGVPVVLNTSFNLNNEPIVMSPENAIRTFYSSGLDNLAIGNYLISK